LPDDKASKSSKTASSLAVRIASDGYAIVATPQGLTPLARPRLPARRIGYATLRQTPYAPRLHSDYITPLTSPNAFYV